MIFITVQWDAQYKLIAIVVVGVASTRFLLEVGKSDMISSYTTPNIAFQVYHEVFEFY